MRLYQLTKQFYDNFELLCIMFLFIWISFYPMPMPQNVRIGLYLFLTVPFLTTVWKKGISIFKKSDWPLWLFLIAIGLNVPFAQQRQIAFITYLDVILPMFLIYYIVSENINSNGKFILLAKVICVASILVALIGIMDFFLGSNFIYEYFVYSPFYQAYKQTGLMRAISTQFHNPPLGSYLIASLPFHYVLIQDKRLYYKLWGYIGVTLIITGIILTFSRGVFLSFVTLLIFVLFITRRYALLPFFFAGIIGIILICSNMRTPFKNYGIRKLLFFQTGICSPYRLDRLTMTYRMVKDHPFAGIGLQHFRVLFPEYYPRKKLVPNEFRIADNMYLTLLSETGLFGFAGFAIFALSFLKKITNRTKTLSHENKDIHFLIVFFSLAGLIFHMNSYDLFYWPNQFLYFCIIIGLMHTFWRNSRNL